MRKLRTILDLTEKIYGRLIVLGIDKRINGKVYWLCKCECKNTCSIITANLKNGHTKSCGCLHYETNCSNALTHGDSTLKEYAVWKAMRQRCNNPNSRPYEDYGGRGIKVCDRWNKSFTNFFNDMGPCPPNKSIDRKDNDGNYEPNNCRWATRKEQLNNTRRNKILSDIEKINIVKAINLKVFQNEKPVVDLKLVDIQ